MNATSSVAAITNAIGDIGTQALVVLLAVLGVAVGYFLFRWGWKKAKGALK